MKNIELNLVEEHLNSNNSPFRFNAKELDATERLENVQWTFLAKGRGCRVGGNYYYGARYGVYPEYSRRDPKWSIPAQSRVEGWLSVDPLAELMPEWSSYAYTFNNPVNFTDPTGMVPQGGGGCEGDDCDPPDQEGGTLGEAVIIYDSKRDINLTDSNYTKDDYRIRNLILDGGGVMATSLLNRERDGNFGYLYDPRKPYAGFAENYAAGHQSWDEDGIANFWMNATSASVVGSLLIVGSPALISQSFQAMSRLGASNQLVRTFVIKSGTDAGLQALLTGDVEIISALASGFGGYRGVVLSIGVSGVDYSFKDGYRDVFGNGDNLPKPLYNAGVDYGTSHFNQLGGKMISPGNLLGRRGANTLTHFGGVFIGDKIKN